MLGLSSIAGVSDDGTGHQVWSSFPGSTIMTERLYLAGVSSLVGSCVRWGRLSWSRSISAGALAPVFGRRSRNATTPTPPSTTARRDRPVVHGQNGHFDFRIRVAAETLKRYPWTTTRRGRRAALRLQRPLEDRPRRHDHSRADQRLGQRRPGPAGGLRAGGLVDYYRYSGDPAAIAHITYPGQRPAGPLPDAGRPSLAQFPHQRADQRESPITSAARRG